MTDEHCRLDLRAYELVRRIVPHSPKKLLEGAVRQIEKDL